MTDRRSFLRGLSAAGALGLAGCGGDGDSSADGPTTAPENPTSTGAPATTQGDSPAPAATSTSTDPPTTEDDPSTTAEDSTTTRAPDRVAPSTLEGFRSAVDATLTEAAATVEQGPYDPTWDSLAAVDPVPDWFRDAKFGIYFHVGPYAVPSHHSEWYPHYMYDADSGVHEHHVGEYGPPDSYPYQQFVPDYTAERFDAAGLADLYERAGARFGGMVAKHADGWSNWDSRINPWNAGDRGPERDLLGELAGELHDRDLPVVATFHHAFTRGYDYFGAAFEQFPSVTEGYPDQVMYGNLDGDLYHDQWLAEVLETVDGYDPDLLYFDSGLETVPADHRQRLLAYYYNRSVAAGSDDDANVAVTHKQEDLPTASSLIDFEEGGVEEIREQPWLADAPISTFSWGYVEGQEYKSAPHIVHLLVDVVSKNGNFMLNLSPRADGSIPKAQRRRLVTVGDWLDIHGDAIYGTRPWAVHGEGPPPYYGFSAEQVRYTRSTDGSEFNAIITGWPESGPYTFQSTVVESGGLDDPHEFTTGSGGDERTARLLGHGPVPYRIDEDNALQVEIPGLSAAERPSEMAVVVQFEEFQVFERRQ